MLVKKAFKTEINPTKAQEQLLRKHIGAKRFVYNWMLAESIFAYENGLKRPSAYDLIKKFRAEIKPMLDWYSEISCKVEEGAARDLDSAYRSFFRRIKSGKAGKDAGFPKFKKKKRGIGSFYTNSVVVYSDSIRIPKLGVLKLKEDKYIPSDIHISNATISSHGEKWFISCQGEIDVAQTGDKHGTIGVDLGIKHAVVLSDGTVIDSPKPLTKNSIKMRRLQKSYSRKQLGSNRSLTANRKIDNLYYRIFCIRSNWINGITSSLAKTKQTIVIEDLNVAGIMRNHSLAGAVSDIGFYEIRRQLEYKCKWYGSNLIIANRWYPSSKICSSCGYKNSNLSLKERDWICPSCGKHLDRDINAAINLASLAPKIEESLNGRGGGSSVDDSNITAQPVCEASISDKLKSGTGRTFINKNGMVY